MNRFWQVCKTPSNEFHLRQTTEPIPDPGHREVLVAIEYSSINFRDMLACRGNLGVTRRFPYTPGVDLSGAVVKSQSEEFKIGDQVFVMAAPPRGLHPGGWAKYARVNEDLLWHKPSAFSPRQMAAIGTAGLSAALGVVSMKSSYLGIDPPKDVLITGATGGVGSLGLALCAGMGFRVTATTRRKDKSDYLYALGAHRVIDHLDIIDESGPNLLKQEYDFALDTLGGKALVGCLKRLKNNGVLSSAGLADTQQIENLTVLPFLMRGVSLIGTGAEVATKDKQKAALDLLEKFLSADKINQIAVSVDFNLISAAIHDMENGHHKGRFIVDIANSGCDAV